MNIHQQISFVCRDLAGNIIESAFQYTQLLPDNLDNDSPCFCAFRLSETYDRLRNYISMDAHLSNKRSKVWLGEPLGRELLLEAIDVLLCLQQLANKFESPRPEGTSFGPVYLEAAASLLQRLRVVQALFIELSKKHDAKSLELCASNQSGEPNVKHR